jgi:hypothetical protein
MIPLRVPGELADEIDAELADGETRSEVGRRLFASWIRKRRAIKRLKRSR